MESMLTVVLNAVVIALLSAAILFGVRLQRRLAALQSAHTELAQLLGRLDGALVHASNTVGALKHTAAKQVETTILRAPAAEPVAKAAPAAPAAKATLGEIIRKAAPVETIKTAPVAVEAAKPATRRRKATSSLVGPGRAAAASELMDIMKSLRNAG